MAPKFQSQTRDLCQISTQATYGRGGVFSHILEHKPNFLAWGPECWAKESIFNHLPLGRGRLSVPLCCVTPDKWLPLSVLPPRSALLCCSPSSKRLPPQGSVCAAFLPEAHKHAHQARPSAPAALLQTHLFHGLLYEPPDLSLSRL